MQEQTLAGRTIAVPETRELDVFAAMLERRGASVLRCPLVAILDAPDPAPVLDWIRWFGGGACDDVILLTGEGLRRLLACIEKNQPQLRGDFVAQLARVRKITRGPKPARALRELGLKPDIAAGIPTTAGVIDALRAEQLANRTVGVQLYGTEPNAPLIDFLQAAGARVRAVAPYIYANKADDSAVSALLDRMTRGEIDAIAFTSTAQVDRLFAVAPATQVLAALAHTHVAAVGPVVADALAQRTVRAASMPTDSFFMKPLTGALEAALAARNEQR
ncbi:MAG TPA: uroporphyrinogen-III synthase [Steroidobacteraceae bacterium]|jgi:Uroporphyrinogen-III synthase|nr:uroporphyrinogen-III synthase [Steroidobacteraceae bacterium]